MPCPQYLEYYKTVLPMVCKNKVTLHRPKTTHNPPTPEIGLWQITRHQQAATNRLAGLSLILTARSNYKKGLNK